MATTVTKRLPEKSSRDGIEVRAPAGPAQRFLGGGSGRRAKPPSGRCWPLIIIALLVGGAGANIGLLVVATGDASFAVEPNYYQKALRWDETMAQEARNAALAWSVTVALDGASGPGQTRVTARVTDRAGNPVQGARVAVEVFHSARASQVLAATLAPESPGRYSAPLPLNRSGLWELRLRVERGDQLFTQTLVQDLARVP